MLLLLAHRKRLIMTLIALLILAISMSTDAFAVAVARGADGINLRFSRICRDALIFGLIEGLTPIIGWIIGRAAKSYIESWDHWVALALLSALGLHMIWENIHSQQREIVDPIAKHPKKNFIILILTAISTSLDALAVGISLAFIDVNIWLTALLIGASTAIMVTIGLSVGKIIRRYIGQWAGILGGIALILIGIFIVIEST